MRYRQFQWAFTPESLQRSRECLEQAIALDPEFALPYFGLADHYGAYIWAGVASDEWFPRARDFALRALELDPDLPEAHAYMGIVAGLYEGNWEEAKRRVRIAMAAEPVHWHIRALAGVFHFQPMGLLAESRRQLKRALEDNPLSQICYLCLGETLEALGLEAEAGGSWKRSVELDAKFWLGWAYGAMHHAVYGRHAEARKWAEEAYALLPTTPITVGVLAGVLEMAGDGARARDVLNGLPADTPGIPVAHACYHLAGGNIEESVTWIGKAVVRNFILTSAFLIRPYEKFLSKSSAWPALLASLGLKPAVTD